MTDEQRFWLCLGICLGMVIGQFYGHAAGWLAAKRRSRREFQLNLHNRN